MNPPGKRETLPTPWGGSDLGYWVLYNSQAWPLSIRGWVGCWVQEQKAEPSLHPSHPLVLPAAWPARGGRAEASQLGTAVVCDLLLALTPLERKPGEFLQAATCPGC